MWPTWVWPQNKPNQNLKKLLGQVCEVFICHCLYFIKFEEKKTIFYEKMQVLFNARFLPETGVFICHKCTCFR